MLAHFAHLSGRDNDVCTHHAFEPLHLPRQRGTDGPLWSSGMVGADLRLKAVRTLVCRRRVARADPGLRLGGLGLWDADVAAGGGPRSRASLAGGVRHL